MTDGLVFPPGSFTETWHEQIPTVISLDKLHELLYSEMDLLGYMFIGFEEKHHDLGGTWIDERLARGTTASVLCWIIHCLGRSGNTPFEEADYAPSVAAVYVYGKEGLPTLVLDHNLNDDIGGPQTHVMLKSDWKEEGRDQGAT